MFGSGICPPIKASPAQSQTASFIHVNGTVSNSDDDFVVIVISSITSVEPIDNATNIGIDSLTNPWWTYERSVSEEIYIPIRTSISCSTRDFPSHIIVRVTNVYGIDSLPKSVNWNNHINCWNSATNTSGNSYKTTLMPPNYVSINTLYSTIRNERIISVPNFDAKNRICWFRSTYGCCLPEGSSIIREDNH